MGEETETRDDNGDVTEEPVASSNADVGLNSRTQSYTSVASSQASRASRLPDYDFGADDRPGSHKKTGSGKKDKAGKEKVGKKQEDMKKQKKVKEKKEKQKKQKKSDKKEKVEKTKDKKKKQKNGSENDAFQLELESAVGQRPIMNESSNNDDVTSASQSDISREPSVTSEKKQKKKSKAKKSSKSKKKSSSLIPSKKSSMGRKKEINKKNKKNKNLSRTNSDASIMTSDDVTENDDVDERDKSKKSKKRGSKAKNKNEPVVVVVNDDDDAISDVIPKRRMFLGICPKPSKKEPLVYNCCMCCSLGAGTLITGIIFVLFCIGFLVIRVEEFKKRTTIGIWNGEHLLPDVWRVFLIIGFMTASFCLLASLLLVVASCLWGSKERYKRIHRVITFWFVATITALINNLGEAVFIQAMPNIKLHAYFDSDNIEDIKSNNVRLWALTGLFTLFFIYITLVLVSYLRMLKYMDSPKIGTTQTQQVLTNPDPVTPRSNNQQRESATQSSENKTQVKNVSETKIKKKSTSDSTPEVPTRARNADRKRSEISLDDIADRIYVNTSFLHEGEEGEEASKSESFKDVINDITNDPKIFDNMSKPKPLKRMPVRRPRPPSILGEAIYMNQDPRAATPSAPYSKVTKPLKRAASFSDIKSPVYDCPPPETDLKEVKNKKNSNNSQALPYGSGDTGFNSRSSVASSVDGSHPDIGEMERLAEELRKKQEALDKSGNCDPATAENLTQMALNALKLSERILQDVKSNENNRMTPVSIPDEERTAPMQQNLKLAESFFDELSRDPNSMTENPIAEMFRMYGKDLCSQNPGMVDRYLRSYKALQENRSRNNFPSDTGISDLVMNEQKPWRSILNPSEAVPAMQQMMPMSPMPQGPMNPLLSSMSHNSVGMFNGEDPRSAFAPPQPTSPVSQPFHTVSHAQAGPPPPTNFYPIEYPMQNSASYNPEPPRMGSQQSNQPHPHSKPPPQYEHSHKYPPILRNHDEGFPYKRFPYDDYYYDEECPYSCCNSVYGDFGSTYGEYGPYPSHYYMGSESIYGDNGMYTGPNWFPMGDPAYSIDPYHNPYASWNDPAPPYTEESTNTSHRSRSNSRGYDSKAASSGRGYSSRSGSRRSSSATRGYTGRSNSRGYTYKSRSLPNLLDDDLYSERSLPGRKSSRSSHNLSQWGIENEEFRDTVGRPSSRLARSRPSSAMEETTRDAFMKGYKAALKEALVTITAKKGEKANRKQSVVTSEDDFLEKLISRVSDKDRSRSPDRPFSSRDGHMARTVSSDSRFTNNSRRTSRDGRSSANPGKESRNLSRSSSARRSSRNMSRLDSRDTDTTDKLPTSISRRTSKLSFRPSSRPGQPMFDDYYDDYRSTSSIPPSRDELDDFGFPRRKSSQTSAGFKGVNSGVNKNKDPDDFFSPLDRSTSRGGRPSTRSRLSSRHSMREKELVRYNDDQSNISYPYSEDGGHFYNKLDLERAFPEPAIPPPEPVDEPKGRRMDRTVSHDDRERSRSHSANARRSDVREMSEHDRSRSVNDTRKNDQEVMWFMGENETEPIYSEYEGLWTGESFPSTVHRNSYPEPQRLVSDGSSKRKSVTFDKSPRIKEVNYRRTSWN